MPTIPESRDAITPLRNEHKEIEALFRQCDKLLRGEQPSAELQALVGRAFQALATHIAVEEQLFYPAMRQALGERSKVLFQYVEEHRVMKSLMSDLRAMADVDDVFNARLVVLTELVRHHIREEEATFFPPCREACGRRLMREIGHTMVDFRKRLLRHVETLTPEGVVEGRAAHP